MSGSQFDDLLADLGGDPAPLKPQSNGAATDEFDPFGGSFQTSSATTNGTGDPGLLLDFTVTSDVQNGDAAVESSSNPLYEMSTDSAPSGNPLYDLSATSSGNPLYDLQAEEELVAVSQGEEEVAVDVNQSANPLYDLIATETPPAHAAEPANPLYQLEQMESHGESLEVTAEVTTEETPEVTLTPEMTSLEVDSSATVDLLGELGDNSATVETSESLQVVEDVEAVSLSLSEEVDQASQAETLAVNTGAVLEPAADLVQDSQEPLADSGLESSQVTQISDQWVSQNEVEVEEKQQVQDIVFTPEPAAPEPLPEMEPVPESPAPAQYDFQQEVLSAEGGVSENEPQQFDQWQNEEEEEEGVYESTPIKRDDVVREADRDITADLPAIGTASNLKAKWATGQVESESAPKPKRALTPPIHGTGGEYVSEPRTYIEKYEGKAEAGVFESATQEQNPDVVTSGQAQEEVLPEQGFAKNVAARFKELEKQEFVPSAKRELTPDRSGRAEYVSEPRTSELVNEEQKPESGVFESQPQVNPDVVRSEDGVEEKLPELGMAKNLASRFKQMSVDSQNYQSSREKRELTPDTSGRVEYVSEPRSSGIEDYEAPRVDAGVFENTPTEDPNVVKSDSLADEFIPERGFAKNLASKFKELENNAKSPTSSPGFRKEFTPPREDMAVGSGVYESTPEVNTDVITSGQQIEEALPERGAAKNIADRFRQMEAASRSPGSTNKPKEFTPPPGESGVFESTPKQFEYDYNRPAESGIIENTPVQREDVVRGDEPPKYEVELPERGFASKMLSQWKQKESQSSEVRSPGSGGRVKEFTPPREEPRIGTYQRTPRTPLSPGGNMDNGSVHPSDLPGQYQPQEVASVFESEPERNPDVVREEDTDWTAGMPKKGAANKMLAKFNKIQTEAKSEEATSPRRESESESVEESETESRPESESVHETEHSQENGSVHTENESVLTENGDVTEENESFQENGDITEINGNNHQENGSIEVEEEQEHSESPEAEPPMENARLKFEDPSAQVGRSKSMRAAIQVEKCGACDKTVYAMERLEMNKRVYHKACFRCSQCKCVVTAKTFSINNDVIFCTTHYKQLFRRKGNYDEGFGRAQHKKRWGSNPDLSAAGEGNHSEAKS